MSVNYSAILWNRQKRIYDLIILLFSLMYLCCFVGFNLIFHPDISPQILVIRATATIATVMLHIILMIGPLARLNKVFLPLLYNRRHLGVSMFFWALVHGGFSIIYFHGFGDIPALVSLFISNTNYTSLTNFPFQTLGFSVLLILMIMAFSSHDFWLKNLNPKIWKILHMLVYLAYALLIMHIMLGILQLEISPIFATILGIGMVCITTLHILASLKTKKEDSFGQGQKKLRQDGWILVGNINSIAENRAKIITYQNRSIAIFKYDNKFSAVNNACKHQNGPLGEGKIIDGCITCPWHGYQYRPQDGCSPAPFTEKVETYDVAIKDNQIWLNPQPYPEGTKRPPAIIH